MRGVFKRRCRWSSLSIFSGIKDIVVTITNNYRQIGRPY